MFEDEDAKKVMSIGKIFGIIIGILIVIAILNPVLNPVRIIGAEERGLVLNWGAYNNQILQPGLHFIIPIAQKVKKVNIQIERYDNNTEAYSKDLQMVDIQSNISFNVKSDEKSISDYYIQYKSDLGGILAPRLEAAVKQIVAKYSAEELLNNRGQIQAEIYDLYKSSEPSCIEIVSYSLVDETFTPEYEKAIEDKQIAQQNAEKANNDLNRIKVEAEQRIEQAKAEAEAIRISAEAIQNQGGEEYVNLKAIEKWNGVLPTQMLPNSTVPFINITPQ